MPRDKDTIDAEARKWIKIVQRLDEDLAEEMSVMGTPELKGRVLQSQANLLENRRGREADGKLASAKARYDDLKAPYDDAKKFQTAIVNYGMLLLEERGAKLSDDDE